MMASCYLIAIVAIALQRLTKLVLRAHYGSSQLWNLMVEAPYPILNMRLHPLQALWLAAKHLS